MSRKTANLNALAILDRRHPPTAVDRAPPGAGGEARGGVARSCGARRPECGASADGGCRADLCSTRACGAVAASAGKARGYDGFGYLSA